MHRNDRRALDGYYDSTIIPDHLIGGDNEMRPYSEKMAEAVQAPHAELYVVYDGQGWLCGTFIDESLARDRVTSYPGGWIETYTRKSNGGDADAAG